MSKYVFLSSTTTYDVTCHLYIIMIFSLNFITLNMDWRVLNSYISVFGKTIPVCIYCLSYLAFVELKGSIWFGAQIRSLLSLCCLQCISPIRFPILIACGVYSIGFYVTNCIYTFFHDVLQIKVHNRIVKMESKTILSLRSQFQDTFIVSTKRFFIN